MTANHDTQLQDWREVASAVRSEVAKVVVGQDRAIDLILTAVFARGHVLLEGDVGVGKTTLLRAVARAIGGAYERIEGTVDLMPNDLIYYTYISEDGKPRVDHGPLLKHGEKLSTFFFNEVNRARPQVHSLMLRVMAERSVTAFNREHYFPHLQVFADRNRVEKDETFEIPPAARDRFLMEVDVMMPTDAQVRETLMFDPRFHDPDALVASVSEGMVAHDQINEIAAVIQNEVQSTETLRRYALELCGATHEPARFGIEVDTVEIEDLVLSGASPRGMSMLVRAAKVYAWIDGRSSLLPDDIRSVFTATMGHRVFFAPVYEMRRSEVVGTFMEQIMSRIAAP